MGKNDTVIRQKLTFYGTVQGVGFRYRAKYAADGCGVTGWVKNEWDGTVTMEAQGTEGQIHEVMKRINQTPYIRIYNITTEEIPLERDERGFHVRY
jgi:acylphosphatase